MAAIEARSRATRAIRHAGRGPWARELAHARGQGRPRAGSYALAFSRRPTQSCSTCRAGCRTFQPARAPDCSCLPCFVVDRGRCDQVPRAPSKFHLACPLPRATRGELFDGGRPASRPRRPRSSRRRVAWSHASSAPRWRSTPCAARYATANGRRRHDQRLSITVGRKVSRGDSDRDIYAAIDRDQSRRGVWIAAVDRAGATVTLIDAASRTIERSFTLGIHPRACVWDSANPRWLYVTEEDDGAVVGTSIVLSGAIVGHDPRSDRIPARLAVSG